VRARHVPRRRVENAISLQYVIQLCWRRLRAERDRARRWWKRLAHVASGRQRRSWRPSIRGHSMWLTRGGDFKRVKRKFRTKINKTAPPRVMIVVTPACYDCSGPQVLWL
jgi:hypothetical protein